MGEEVRELRWLRAAFVVEDNPRLGRRLARWLRRWGAQTVEVATTSAVAAERLAALGAGLDLLLCDVYLDDGRCDPVLRAARRFAPHTRLVLMTGRAASQERTDLVYAAQPHAFVAKPVTPRELYLRLSGLDDVLTSQAVGWMKRFAVAAGFEDAHAAVKHDVADAVVRDAGGNVSEAARRMKMHRPNLHRLIKTPAGARSPGARGAARGDEEEDRKRTGRPSGERAIDPALREPRAERR